MKRLKKTARLFGLVILMILATVGMGISGAVPVPPTNKKDPTEEVAEAHETGKTENQSELGQQ